MQILQLIAVRSEISCGLGSRMIKTGNGYEHTSSFRINDSRDNRSTLHDFSLGQFRVPGTRFVDSVLNPHFRTIRAIKYESEVIRHIQVELLLNAPMSTAEPWRRSPKERSLPNRRSSG